MGLFDGYVEDAEGNLHAIPKVGRPKKSLSDQQDSKMVTDETDSQGHHIYIRECSSCGKEVRFTRGDRPAECPWCGNKFWDKPRDEFKLFMLQEKFIERGRDEKVLGEMYETLESYSETLVKKALRNRIVLTPEEIHDKASDMALSLIDSFRKSDTYVIHGSFGGLLSKIRLGVMFSSDAQMHDKMLSLDAEIKDNMSLMDNPTVYLADGLLNADAYEVNAATELEKADSAETDKKVCNLIFEEEKTMRECRDDWKDGILFLAGMRNYLKNDSKCTADELYSIYGDTVREDVEYMLRKIKEQLVESAS